MPEIHYGELRPLNTEKTPEVKKPSAPWMAQFKLDQRRVVEYSVVRTDFNHGQISWGWFDRDIKRAVVTHSGPGAESIDKYLAIEHLETTINYALRLNAQEGNSHHNVIFKVDAPYIFQRIFNEEPPMGLAVDLKHAQGKADYSAFLKILRNYLYNSEKEVIDVK